MSFQIRGPRAAKFVELLGKYSGLSLMLKGDALLRNPDGLINPNASLESDILRDLVLQIIKSPNVVEINAFGGIPSAGFFVDSFDGDPSIQLPRRSVFTADLIDLERLKPVLARAMMGHVLREYFGAARPPGQTPGRAMDVYHVPAIRTEAEIASELTGLPIFGPGTRPWEKALGVLSVRVYGPNFRYQLVSDTDGTLSFVIGP
jgi:hypothetical protein